MDTLTPHFVTPGETLTLYVGEGTYTGSGGGASAIYRGSDLIAIAGGGGGGASDGNSGDSWAGGAGGAGGNVAENGMDLLYHQQGMSYSYCTAATGGTGATQSAAGIGGVPSGNAEYQGVSRLCFGADGGPLEGGGATGDSPQCNFTGATFGNRLARVQEPTATPVQGVQATLVAAAAVRCIPIAVPGVAVAHLGLPVLFSV